MRAKTMQQLVLELEVGGEGKSQLCWALKDE